MKTTNIQTKSVDYSQKNYGKKGQTKADAPKKDFPKPTASGSNCLANYVLAGLLLASTFGSCTSQEAELDMPETIKECLDELNAKRDSIDNLLDNTIEYTDSINNAETDSVE